MIGLGIIGHGMASKPHIAALKDLQDRVQVLGVHSRNVDSRAAFCREWDLPEAPDFDALLQNPDLDAILMLTPPNARVEMAQKAARAGKHILMEKPVARTTAEAEQVVSACEDAGVKLGIIFQHRFRAGAQAFSALIESGRLGRLASAYLMVPWWRPQSYYDEPGRGTMARDGGGVLISQAIHSMDLMLSLTGPVDEVQAVAGTSFLHQMETEDFVGAGLRFGNGAMGSIMATVTAFPGETEYMVLNFENGSAKLHGGTLQLHWQNGETETFGEEAETGGGADPMAFPYDWHMAQIADFIEAINDDRQPQSNGKTALNVHRLIDALLASSREARLIKVTSG